MTDPHNQLLISIIMKSISTPIPSLHTHGKKQMPKRGWSDLQLPTYSMLAGVVRLTLGHVYIIQIDTVFFVGLIPLMLRNICCIVCHRQDTYGLKEVFYFRHIIIIMQDCSWAVNSYGKRSRGISNCLFLLDILPWKTTERLGADVGCFMWSPR